MEAGAGDEAVACRRAISPMTLLARRAASRGHATRRWPRSAGDRDAGRETLLTRPGCALRGASSSERVLALRRRGSHAPIPRHARPATDASRAVLAEDADAASAGGAGGACDLAEQIGPGRRRCWRAAPMSSRGHPRAAQRLRGAGARPSLTRDAERDALLGRLWALPRARWFVVGANCSTPGPLHAGWPDRSMPRHLSTASPPVPVEQRMPSSVRRRTRRAGTPAVVIDNPPASAELRVGLEHGARTAKRRRPARICPWRPG